jgi:hypothetical protein
MVFSQAAAAAFGRRPFSTLGIVPVFPGIIPGAIFRDLQLLHFRKYGKKFTLCSYFPGNIIQKGR